MENLRDFFKLRRLNVPRLVHALGLVEERAVELGVAEVLPVVRSARAFAGAALKIERAYQRQQNPLQLGPKTSELDPKLDKALSRLFQLLSLQSTLQPEGSELRTRVDALLLHLFPNGVNAITSLSYPEQFVACEQLLADAEPHQELISALALQAAFDGLRQQVEVYGASLAKRPTREITPAQRKQLADEGQEWLTRVVVAIMHRFSMDTGDDRHGRRVLLGPIVAQHHELGERRMQKLAATRRRRDAAEPSGGAATSQAGDDAEG